jgi:hypothetical protein
MIIALHVLLKYKKTFSFNFFLIKWNIYMYMYF